MISDLLSYGAKRNCAGVELLQAHQVHEKATYFVLKTSLGLHLQDQEGGTWHHDHFC